MASEKVMCEQFSRGVMLSIVVPTYMERESLPELVGRIESSLRPIEFEVIIVDDASPDGTADCAEDLNRNYGNIKTVKRGRKLGLSSAVLDGFQTASAQVLAIIDADLQHPPELLSGMYTKISKGYDLVIASRYTEGGVIEGWSLRRRIISKGATFLAHMLLPRTRKVRDVLSGFFMLRRDIIKEVRLNTVGFKILLEIIVRGNYSSVAEVPYTFVPRKRGKSNLNLRELWNYIVQIYRLL
jgi:dolichol-phosphate mannosyltransferase